MKNQTNQIFSEKGFYIGDICYVLNNNIYHNIWGKKDGNGERYKNGIITVPAGTVVNGEPTEQEHYVWVNVTAYGDGVYQDQLGNEYGVDAGNIGVVPLELIEDMIEAKRLGKVVHLSDEAWIANCKCEDGVFQINIGSLHNFEINTMGLYEGENEDTECEYDEYSDDKEESEQI
jgi:hypothetical protein